MTVALDGVAGVWTRVGTLVKTINDVDTFTGATTNTRVADAATEYASNEQEVFAAIWGYRDEWRQTPASWTGSLMQLAADTVVAQVDRDVTLLSATLADALAELNRQMRAASESLNRPTLGASFAAGGSNVGDTTAVATTTAGDGEPNDCVFVETIPFRVTSASAAAEFTETLTYEANPAAAATDYDWPQGSGASGVVVTVDPAAASSFLSNGGFETWTVANTPDDWEIDVGTAGAQVLQGSSPRRGTYNLRLSSDGATLTTLRQTFAQTLQPLTLYAVTFSAKVSATTATGTFRVALVDDTDTVVNDALGNANTYSVGVNGGGGIDTTYAQFTTWFRTPAKVDDGWKLELAFTTAPTSGRTVDVDLVGFAEPSSLYTGGPYVIFWGNSVTPIVGDYWTLTVTNSLGKDSLVRAADRLFSTRELGVKLPTSGSPTVADALIA